MSDVREFFDGLETYIQIVLILEYSVTADMLSAANIAVFPTRMLLHTTFSIHSLAVHIKKKKPPRS